MSSTSKIFHVSEKLLHKKKSENEEYAERTNLGEKRVDELENKCYEFFSTIDQTVEEV